MVYFFKVYVHNNIFLYSIAQMSSLPTPVANMYFIHDKKEDIHVYMYSMYVRTYKVSYYGKYKVFPKDVSDVQRSELK